MRIFASELAICVACLEYTTKGEVGDGGRTTEEVAAAIGQEWGDHAGGLTAACGENCDGWFSWSPCEGCGSTLGGERHPAVVLVEG